MRWYYHLSSRNPLANADVGFSDTRNSALIVSEFSAVNPSIIMGVVLVNNQTLARVRIRGLGWLSQNEHR